MPAPTLTQPDPRPAAPAADPIDHPPVIRADGLARRFGPIVAVDGLDLHVPPGSVYGFLGPNGAGKTTTIRMLLGLIRPDRGQVRLFDQPLAGQRTALLRRVGALVESPSLYPHLTGYENLEVTRRLLGTPRAQIDRALAIVQLAADAHRPVRGYSMGMRQRLGLALALLDTPDLLILDEPTNGLDPAGIHEMRDLIRRLPAAQGITVFLSSHLLREVEQVATHIGIIHQGRMLFQGPLAALQARREERLVVQVSRPAEAQRLLAAAGWAGEAGDDGRLVVAARTPAAAAAINALLVRQGLEVSHLRLEQPSLEEIFLQLTGAPRDERNGA